MTPEQCIAARRLLGWSRIQLAVAAYCSSSTVKAFEERTFSTQRSTRSAIAAAFEAAGVALTADAPRFAADDPSGVGAGRTRGWQGRPPHPGLAAKLQDLAKEAESKGFADTADLLRVTLAELQCGPRAIPAGAAPFVRGRKVRPLA